MRALPRRLVKPGMQNRQRMATRRLDELIADAGEHLTRMSAQTFDSAGALHAGWATYRALGFLEACTVFDPEHAEQLLVAFEPVMRLMDGLTTRPAVTIDPLDS